MADKQFPRTEAEVNLLFQTMKNQLPGLNAQLELAAADVEFFIKQAENYQYIFNITQDISDQREAFTAWKRSIFDGDPVEPAPSAPIFPVLGLPQAPANGLETTAKAIIKRIKASPGYNETIGEQLGLVDTGQAGFNPDDLVASLKLTAKSASAVEIAFSKQGQDAMRVEFQRKGDTAWTLAGIYTSSPGTHDAPSVPPDEPESRLYRGILLKKNSPIGNHSPIYPIVTTP
jgi:hypothetical protein